MSELEDRIACIDLMSKYAWAIDHKDWDLLKTVFGPRVLWDLSQVGGFPAAELAVDELIAFLRPNFSVFVATHHSMTNHRVTVTGDRATIGAHMRAEHWADPELVGSQNNLYGTAGFYDDDAVRTADGWKFVRVRIEITHVDGEDVWAIIEPEMARRAALEQPA